MVVKVPTLYDHQGLNVGNEGYNVGSERLNFVPVSFNVDPERLNVVAEGLEVGSEHLNFVPEGLNVDLERLNVVPEGLAAGSETEANVGGSESNVKGSGIQYNPNDVSTFDLMEFRQLCDRNGAQLIISQMYEVNQAIIGGDDEALKAFNDWFDRQL